MCLAVHSSPHSEPEEQTVTMTVPRGLRRRSAPRTALSTDPHALFVNVDSVIPDDDEEELIFTKQLTRPLRSDTAVTVPRAYAPDSLQSASRKTLPPVPQLPLPRAVQYTLPPVPIFPSLPDAEHPVTTSADRVSPVPAPRLNSSPAARRSTLPPRPVLPSLSSDLLEVLPQPASESPAQFEVFDPRKQPDSRRPGYVEAYAPWPEPPAKSEALITFAKGWGPPPRDPMQTESIVLPGASRPPSRILRLFGNDRDVRRTMLFGFAAGLIAMVVVCAVALATRFSDDRSAANTRTVSASDDQGFAVVQATVFVDGVARCFELPCELRLDRQRHWLTVRSPNHEAPPARMLDTAAPVAQVHLELKRVARVLPPLPPEHVARGQAVPAAAPVSPAPVLAAVPQQPGATDAPLHAEPVAAVAVPVPQPKAKLAPSNPRPAALAPGRLNINSIPTSHVVLDGRPLGQTPQLGVRVSPGRHTVVFINGDQRAVRGVHVLPGGTKVVAARL